MMMLFLYCTDNLTPLQQARFELHNRTLQAEVAFNEIFSEISTELKTVYSETKTHMEELRDDTGCVMFFTKAKQKIERQWVTIKREARRLKRQLKSWISAC